MPGVFSGMMPKPAGTVKPRHARRGRLAALLLAATILPLTWFHAEVPRIGAIENLRIDPLPVPLADRRPLGPFRFEGAWLMQGQTGLFGGFSALLAPDPRWLIAVSDQGYALDFATPGMPVRAAKFHWLYDPKSPVRRQYDAEGADYDPNSGKTWVSFETINAIVRYGPTLAREAAVRPRQMADWGDNGGAESLARLGDGRFLVIRESADGWIDRGRHRALIFPGDPIDHPHATEFTLAVEAGFSPVDAAQIPDGRVLVLLRRITWPLPIRFETAIAVFDPRHARPGATLTARTLTKIAAPMPSDNYEGLGLAPGPDGCLAAWLIADANGSAFQRDLLMLLSFDPRDIK